MNCSEDTACVHAEALDSTSTIPRQLVNSAMIIPVAFAFLLYGIFTVLFGLSIYIFRRKFTPGKHYIIATIYFFTLATVSVILELIFICTASVPLTPLYDNLLDSGISRGYIFQTALGIILLIIGSLADLLLIQRCYHLWNSRKRFVIAPIIGVLFSCAAWIFATASHLGSIAYVDYIVLSIIQNLYLSGMIAGRIWWSNRKLKKVLVGVGYTSQSLLGPILESAILTPIFLILWVGLNYSGNGGPDGRGSFLGPCALTQIVGISSTLIFVRIGLGIDALTTSQTYPISASVSANIQTQTSPISHSMPMEDLGSNSTRFTHRNWLITPFDLKHDSGQTSGLVTRDSSLMQNTQTQGDLPVSETDSRDFGEVYHRWDQNVEQARVHRGDALKHQPG
ncbi:hypothetical protein C8J55DRAFT_608110 [Lentinula edodes]|uniref:Uncharacterized protein n=1 Tax=Lentinula lateritia TaxID=40482 RepID=A0A9W9A117_9AGAR|nr:hypothetical protein C8J55DRAFT_608110 [Lentinula edodes]